MTSLSEINATEIPTLGAPPVLDWVSKDLLDIEALYQRPEDVRRVHAIVKAFDWKKFGALVVTPKADGRFNVIDGQHRSSAAKLHPGISTVPAVIVTTSNIVGEASAFIGLNGERKNTNPLDLFFARLAADHEDALDIFHVCSRAGIDVAKHPKSHFKPRQTIAVSTVAALINKRGAMRAREVLQIVAAGNFAPITGTQIKAIEALQHDPEFAGQAAGDDLKTLLGEVGTSLDGEAKRFAATHNCPLWKALASVWFQKCKKTRAPRPAKPNVETNAEPFIPQIGKKVPTSGGFVSAPRPQPQPTGHPTTTGSICGDPLPGRSALDQRGVA